MSVPALEDRLHRQTVGIRCASCNSFGHCCAHVSYECRKQRLKGALSITASKAVLQGNMTVKYSSFRSYYMKAKVGVLSFGRKPARGQYKK